MKTYLDSEKSEVRIEIVPLIDVVFCILVFFILGAVRLTAPDGIGVDLPEASTGEPQLEETLTVRLDASGAISIRNISIFGQAKLKQELTNYLVRQPGGLIVLEADKQARYEQVIRVVDILREIGGDRVALETIQPQPGAVPSGLPAPQTPLPAIPGTTPGSSTLPAPPGQQPAGTGVPGQPQPGVPAPATTTTPNATGTPSPALPNQTP